MASRVKNVAYDSSFWQLPKECMRRVIHVRLTTSTCPPLALLHHLTHLQELHVTFSKVTNEALKVVARMLKDLKVLILNYSVSFTDEGVSELCGGCTGLQHMSLYGCTQLTDVGVSSLSDLKTLTRLNVGHCPRLTDRCIAALSAATQLKELNLSENKNISDTGISYIASLTQLQVLDLTNCGRLTDASIWIIAHSMQRLQTLCISDVHTHTRPSDLYLKPST